MKKQYKKCALAILVSIVVLAAGVVSTAYAQESVPAADTDVVLYFFWGDGCPHCKRQKPFLEYLEGRYPQLKIESFETWYEKKNAKLYVDMAQSFGVRPSGVPATFLGDRVWIGYTDYIAEEIEEQVQACIELGCINPVERLLVPIERSSISQFDKSISPLKPVCMHAFLQEGCPQCVDTAPYLDSLTDTYNVELVRHNVSLEDQEKLYERFKEIYGFSEGGYPTVFIGDRFLVGTKAIRNNLEREIKACSQKGCICPAQQISGLTPYPPQPKDFTPEKGSTVVLPVVGTIDAGKISLPLFTAILGGLDSFNPCAFFVLFILLGMLIHAKSRARMALIGGTFVFVSGFIYFLFMAAWLNLFMMVGHLTVITVAAGMVALVVAALNIKDYFFFGKGASLVIPEKAKPKLFQRMRGLLKATSITSMMIGTIVLAIGANAYELLCTAGFPMVFTRILTLHELSYLQYYFYLALYNVVYVIPLLVIVLIFVITLGGRKLTEEQGQVLKLVSGLMMLCLGLILLIEPALLNNIFVAAGILAAVLVCTAAIVAISKLVKKRLVS